MVRYGTVCVWQGKSGWKGLNFDGRQGCPCWEQNCDDYPLDFRTNEWIFQVLLEVKKWLSKSLKKWEVDVTKKNDYTKW